MKLLTLSRQALTALQAGDVVTLRRSLRPPPDEEPLPRYLDFVRREILWGYDLPAEGPSHGTLAYRNAKGETTEMRELSPGRVRTWRAPWQVGERLAVREKIRAQWWKEGNGPMPWDGPQMVAEVVTVRVERGAGGLWEFVAEVRRLEGKEAS